MNNKKKAIIAVAAVLLIAVAAFLFFFKDMSGMPYSEIEAYIEANPYKVVSYSVTLSGGEEPLKITNRDETVTLTSCEQVADLTAQAEYLQHLTAISFADLTPDAQSAAAVIKAFPNADIQFAQAVFLGSTYPCDTTQLDLSHITSEDVEDACSGIHAFPALKTVLLSKEGETLALTLDDVARLQQARADVFYDFTVELYGQRLTSDMETVEYFRVPMGNDALDTFRKLIPVMPNLTYLKLDTCEIDNELLYQFRNEFKDKCKVVWRVFFGQNNTLTDTYKIWATWNIDTKEADVLKYCNEVKYLDLGHNSFMNLDFMKEMTELEMAIVAIGNLHDISGIVNCTKLEFLEIFSNRTLDDEDMQHLSALTNMKYLNISNTIKMRDLSFTDNMPKLRKLWNTLSRVPQAEIQRVKELHPDCQFVFMYDGDPTDYGWRYTRESGYREMTPEYQLVRARFGYETWDFNRDEKGYLREEITYESLGLTPS